MQETDFSKDQIQKAVNRDIAQHSLTLFPAAAGVLGLLWGALFAAPAALALGGLGILTSVCFASIQKFGRFGKLTTAYVNQLRNTQKKALLNKLSNIKPELERLGCHQGAAQVDLLQSKFQGLEDVIAEKLANQPDKSSRLSAIAEKLHLATIENLLHAGQILKSVEAIDVSYLDEQIARAHTEAEKESLLARKALKLEGVDAAEHCIANNELAMTKVSQLAVDLARTKSQNSAYDLEESLHEITNSVRVDSWETA